MTFQSLKVLLYLSYYYIIRTLLNIVLCLKSYSRVNPGDEYDICFNLVCFKPNNTEFTRVHPRVRFMTKRWFLNFFKRWHFRVNSRLLVIQILSKIHGYMSPQLEILMKIADFQVFWIFAPWSVRRLQTPSSSIVILWNNLIILYW